MSYVSAEPVTQPTPPPLTIASVHAAWLQNAGAGAGVAAIVIALRLLWHALLRSLINDLRMQIAEDMGDKK